MSPDVLRRAFDPFFTTKGPGGSGLGLSQVYGMARQSGGTVRIDSTPGEGTVVTLLLPRASAEAEVEGDTARRDATVRPEHAAQRRCCWWMTTRRCGRSPWRCCATSAAR